MSATRKRGIGYGWGVVIGGVLIEMILVWSGLALLGLAPTLSMVGGIVVLSTWLRIKLK